MLDSLECFIPKSKEKSNVESHELSSEVAPVYYISVEITPDSPMPGVRLGLLLGRLGECGTIVYSNPSRADLKMHVPWQGRLLNLVLQTSAHIDTIQTECSLSEIRVFRYRLLDQNLFLSYSWPSREEIRVFNRLAKLFTAALDARDNRQIGGRGDEYVKYCASVSDKMGWFPGSSDAWNRQIAMIASYMRRCLSRSDFNEDVLSALNQLVRFTWWSFMNGIWNKMYITVLRPVCLSEKSELVTKYLDSGQVVDLKVVVMDISSVGILEPAGLLYLSRLKRECQDRGLAFIVLSEGESARMHFNIIEATGLLTGLRCCTQLFQAFEGLEID